jgi:hypothetical protein
MRSININHEKKYVSWQGPYGDSRVEVFENSFKLDN